MSFQIPYYGLSMDIISERSSENCLHGAGGYESLKTIETNFEEPVNELIKSLSWIDNNRVQRYEGHMLNESLHGAGHYVWSRNVFRPLSESVISTTYEGTFYANSKEGYGLLSYKDGSTFEGLFKAGEPFGPGVFTESNGSQNVGIWRSSRLNRIYVAVDGVPRIAESSAAKVKLMKYRRLVPGVQECGVVEDFTRLVLSQMGASETITNKSHSKLFNPKARSPKSLFFNQCSHEKAYFNEPDSCEDEVVSLNEAGDEAFLSEQTCNTTIQSEKRMSDASSLNKRSSDASTHKTEASIQEIPTPTMTYLVAWNNEPFMVDVLSHVYRNRPFERDVTFDIGQLVTGQRKRWRCSGDHEEVAHTYLKAAAEGAKEQVQRIVTFFALDENVSDARGNNAVHFAAAGDFCDIVNYLVREGVNVNQQNDEGLTPLALSLARYVTVRNRAARWELAFLPPPSEILTRPDGDCEPLEWNLRHSKSSIIVGEDDTDDDAALEIFMAQLAKAGGKLTDDIVVPVRKYLMSLRPLLVLPERSETGDKKKKGKEKKGAKGGNKSEKTGSEKENKSKDGSKKAGKKGKKKDTETDESGSKKKKKNKVVLEEKEPEEEPVDPAALTQDEVNELFKIEATIFTLLDLGADPNIGQSPASPLILSLFARNAALADALLSRGAFATAPSLGHGFGLAPLHIVCLMAPVLEGAELVRLLVAYGADPHAEADLGYDINGKSALLAGLDEVDEAGLHGMTPLHTLALRSDFRHGVETAALLTELIGAVVAASGEPICRHDYLGHSPLSLGAFRGDADTVRALLALGKFDPNEELGLGLGNVLSVLASLRFFDLFPVADRIKLSDLLIAHGANPLQKFTTDDGDFHGNVVDFCNAEVRKEIEKQPNPKKVAKEVLARLKEYKKFTSSLLDRARGRQVRCALGGVTVALASAARKVVDLTGSRQDLTGKRVKELANLLTEWELVRCLVLLTEGRRIAPTSAEAALMLASVRKENQMSAQFAGPTNAEILVYLQPLLRPDDDIQETGDPGDNVQVATQ